VDGYRGSEMCCELEDEAFGRTLDGLKPMKTLKSSALPAADGHFSPEIFDQYVLGDVAGDDVGDVVVAAAA
jgi:hypothetical protein